MKRQTRFWIAAALLLAAAGAASAGGVTVKYQDPDKFTDVPFWEQDRDQVLKELTTHFEALARQLPANQQLSITVTDIDLAGRVEPRRRSLHDLRILRGGGLADDGTELYAGTGWQGDCQRYRPPQQYDVPGAPEPLCRRGFAAL